MDTNHQMDSDKCKSNDDNYDPHLFRKVPNATTNIETFVHLVKAFLGTGILAMPQAFYHAGYVSGFIGTIMLGIICTYCLHILVNAQYILCKRNRVPILSYSISMKMALEQGPKCLQFLSAFAVPIVDGFILIYQVGICCVFIVFVSSNIKQIADYCWTELDIRIYMTILLLPFILLLCVKNLKFLVPFSTFANVITFIGLGLIMYYIFDGIQAPSNHNAFGALENFPLFFGTTLFALESIGVVIAVENNMKTPKSYGGYFGVLNQSMTVIVILYTFLGFIGYMRYGDKCEGSITLNLPQNDILSQSVKILFAIAVFVTYGLQGYVPVEIIWKSYLMDKLKNSKNLTFYEYLTRISVAVLTYLLAIAIPKLGLFISLVGALCLSVLGLAFPALMEIYVLYPVHLSKLNLFKNILLIIFGLIGLVVGTYTSIYDIVISFMK